MIIKMDFIKKILYISSIKTHAAFPFNAKRFMSKTIRFQTVEIFCCDVSQNVSDTNYFGLDMISNIQIFESMKCPTY